MTVKELIEYTDKIKPNAVEEEIKLTWASEAEGLVRTEIFGEDPENCKKFDENSADTALSVPLPYARLYYFYLAAMIDFVNGEFEKYDNSSAAFEKAMHAYSKWYIRNR